MNPMQITKRHRTTQLDVDEFLGFYEDGKIVAEFGTTKEEVVKYNALRAQWNHEQIDAEKLKKHIELICVG